MPTTSPTPPSDPSLWEDVRHDPSATHRLIRELLATAGAVGEVVAVLRADGPIIAEDWGGPHRERFDAGRRAMVEAADQTAMALAGAARLAAALLASAEGEQRLRVRMRNQVLLVGACAPGRPC
jgi:hypothetical protein